MYNIESKNLIGNLQNVQTKMVNRKEITFEFIECGLLPVILQLFQKGDVIETSMQKTRSKLPDFLDVSPSQRSLVTKKLWIIISIIADTNYGIKKLFEYVWIYDDLMNIY